MEQRTIENLLLTEWSDFNYYLDSNLYLTWYLRIKEQQAIKHDCKPWDIPRGFHN